MEKAHTAKIKRGQLVPPIRKRFNRDLKITLKRFALYSIAMKHLIKNLDALKQLKNTF